MKKIILSVVLMLCIVTSMFSKELNTRQLQLRSDIKLFLKEEGYMPEYDSDGDIKFKSEGRVYYVSVSDVDESPMYVCLSSGYNYGESFNSDMCYFATRELNLYKGVKVLCAEKSFSIRAEMYLADSEHFKQVFYKMMNQIKSVSNDYIDEFKKFK